MNSLPRVTFLLLLTLVAALLAGKTMTVGQRDHVVWEYRGVDIATNVILPAANPDYIPGCRTNVADVGTIVNTTAKPAWCFPDPGLNGFQLLGFGATIATNLAAGAGGGNFAGNANCQLELVTQDSASTTPLVVNSSTILVGDGLNNANTNCVGILDKPGEACFRALDTTDPNTWIEPGGWWAIRLSQHATGDCKLLPGIQTTVKGYYP